MRQPARLRNYYRKTLSRQQRRNRWLLYAGLVLLAVVGNRCTASCTRAKVVEPAGRLAVMQ